MENNIEYYKNIARSSLYDYACKLSYLSPDDEWIRDKIQHVSDVLQRAVELSENLIILIRGQPSSGKTYLIRRSITSVLDNHKKINKKINFNNTHIIEICAYDFIDDTKCMRELLNRLELLVGSNADPNTFMLVSQVQNRIIHTLKLLKRQKSYLIIVIDGFEVFTKGSYDCSITTGSCSRRQGLLYFLSDSMQLKETSFTVIYVTSDLNCIDRMEKRVKSRFVYEPVYCFSYYDITEYFNESGESRKILPNCLVKAEKEKFASMSQDSICERDRNHMSIDASISLLMLKDNEFKVKKDKDEVVVQVPMKKDVKEEILVFEHLSVPEHCILVSLARLHIKGVYPQTLNEIIGDLGDMVNYFPTERYSLPNKDALRRVFLELVEMGMIEWVNYSENNIDNVKINHSVNDPSGFTMPCRFPKYREYIKMKHTQFLPTHLSQWLSMADRTGEEVSNSVVLNIVSNSINKLKEIEKINCKVSNGNNSSQQHSNDENMLENNDNTDNDNKQDNNNNENGQNNKNKYDLDPNKDQTLSKEELWKLRVKKLNEFSVPYKDSSEIFDHQIEFLESVHKYTSSQSN